MTIVAKAEFQSNYIIPMPFDLIPENIQGDELIIIAILDTPPSSKQLARIYSFYGEENCHNIIGKLPSSNKDKTVICLKSKDLIGKALNFEGQIPHESICPLWTKEKFGISSLEAESKYFPRNAICYSNKNEKIS